MPRPTSTAIRPGKGALVNAYLVETSDGIVAVDGTLTVTDGRALRARLEALGKPLLAVLVTHAHRTTTAASSSSSGATTCPSSQRPASMP